MKNTLFIAVLLFANSLNAQEKTAFPYKNSFSFNLSGPLNHSCSILYERGYAKRSSVVFSVGCYYSKLTGDDWVITKTGILTELHDRIYFYSKQSEVNEKKWNRVYTGPCVFYQYFDETEDFKYENNYTFSSFGGAWLIGYNLTFRHFSFEIYLGLGGKLRQDDSNVFSKRWYDRDFWEPGYEGPIAKGGINVGIAF